ncbi:MAG: hypothetical protein AMS27_10745, partial [Bacteroides sp. SM23_62_1]
MEALASDRIGSIVALGYFTGSATIDDRQLDSYGGQDIILIKYSDDGDTLWIKQIGSSGDDRAKDVITDEDGNVYVTGSFSDSTLFDGRYLRSKGGQDIFLAKYNPDGDTLWIKNVGWGYGDDRGNDLTISGNEIHMAGFFDDTLIFGPDTLVDNGYTNNFLATFDLSGNYDCSMQIICTNNDTRINSISTAQDGGCLISGLFLDTLKFTDATETEYKYASRSVGQPDIFLARMYPNKTLAWARTAGSTGDDQGMDARSDANGNIYLTGYFSLTTYFDSTKLLQSQPLVSKGGYDIFMAKYNSQGRLLWKKGFGGEYEDLARRMDVFEDKVVFTGHISDTVIIANDTLATTGPTDNDTGFGLSNDGGDFILFNQIRGDKVDRGMGIANDQFGAVYIVGFYRSTELYVGDYTLTNPSPGKRNGFVAKGVWPLSLAITDQINVSCNGGSDGIVSVTPYYGEPPYTFDWEHNPALHDSTATGLAAGDYKVIATDDVGQKDSLIVTITEPALLEIDKNITDVTCNGLKTGAINITVSGGTQPYSYDWTGSGVIAGNEDQVNLQAGTYNVEVTDENGCTLDSTFIVIQPAVLATSITGTDVTGAGNGDGTIDLTVTGGTPAYGYAWTGPDGYTNNIDEDPIDL